LKLAIVGLPQSFYYIMRQSLNVWLHCHSSFFRVWIIFSLSFKPKFLVVAFHTFNLHLWPCQTCGFDMFQSYLPFIFHQRTFLFNIKKVWRFCGFEKWFGLGFYCFFFTCRSSHFIVLEERYVFLRRGRYMAMGRKIFSWISMVFLLFVPILY